MMTWLARKNCTMLSATTIDPVAANDLMVRFEGGSYQVGSEDGADAERPVRKITLDPFLVDANLVTNRDFAAFVDSTGHVTDAERRGGAWGLRGGAFGLVEGLSWRSCADAARLLHPVVLVSWNDAQAFAQWVGKRLPTEWEWEAAASNGIGIIYPWGDDEPGKSRCPWGREAAWPPPTSQIASFGANGSGLFDMVGNVWQWCENCYDDEIKSLRARRGGAWNVIQDFRLRCANRGALPADTATPNMGFRCAKTA